MKITIDIDCTPEEARRFLGFPDMSAMQERLVGKLEERMNEAMEGMDTEALMKLWMPSAAMGQASAGMAQNLSDWTAMQKSFWQQMMGAAQAGGSDDGDDGKSD